MEFCPSAAQSACLLKMRRCALPGPHPTVVTTHWNYTGVSPSDHKKGDMLEDSQGAEEEDKWTKEPKVW